MATDKTIRKAIGERRKAITGEFITLHNPRPVERRESDRKFTDPNSISKLAIRHCDLGKDTLCVFPWGPSSLPVRLRSHI